MLIDLKNSPIDKKDQLFFGIFTSLCLVIFYILKLNYNITLSGYTFAQLAEIMAILLANVIFFFTHRLIEQPNVNKIQSN
jgi:hypothetical protein